MMSRAALLAHLQSVRSDKSKSWSIPREWPGEAVFIIGGGTSVITQPLELLRGRRIIVINSSYERVLGLTPLPHLPHADLLYFADGGWWIAHRKKLATFPARIVSTSTSVTSKQILRLRNSHMGDRRIRKLPIELSEDPTRIPMRRTSFAAALNIAYHLNGGAPLVILGADGRMGADRDGNPISHHHEKHHGWQFKADRWPRHREDLSAMIGALNARGVSVINASPGSAWSDLCPTMDLVQAMASLGDAKAAA